MRRRFATTLAAALFILADAGRAQAQCEFQAGKANRLRVPLVRTYSPCFDDYPFLTTEGGVDACSPVVAKSLYYGCSEGIGYCYGPDFNYCPSRSCADYLSPYPFDYYFCDTNADCPAPPYSSGECLDHPQNVCEPDAGSVTRRSFNDKGGCSLMATADIEEDCSRVKASSGAPLGLPARACQVTTLKAKCHGVLGADGSTPIYNDGDWVLRTLTRVTMDDAVAGDVITVDFPLSFLLESPGSGRLKLKVNTAEVLEPLLGTSGAALPPCTHLQPIGAKIEDPEGFAFAEVGLSTQP